MIKNLDFKLRPLQKLSFKVYYELNLYEEIH